MPAFEPQLIQRVVSDYLELVAEDAEHPLRERFERIQPEEQDELALLFQRLAVLAGREDARAAPSSADVDSLERAVVAQKRARPWIRLAGADFLSQIDSPRPTKERLLGLLS